jgi:hypothetical protein
MKIKYSRIKELPKFVMMMQDGKKGCAMRLLDDKDEYQSVHGIYWRDGGLWGIDARMENGKLVSDAKMYGDELQYLDGQDLISITEGEWKEDNGRYAPSLKKVEETDDIAF